MGSKLSPHREEIRKLLDAGKSQREVATKYKVGRTTLRDFINSDEYVTGVSREEKLEAEIKELKKKARAGRTVDVQYSRLEEVIEEPAQAAPVQFEPGEVDVGQNHEHVQALLLSDLHAGEIVEPEAMNGFNAYDWDILMERMERIYTSLLSYQANRPYPITELQIWQLGDMCSGSNHAEITETNEYAAAEQGVKVGQLLGSWVERLVPHYERIKVVSVAGNHPRVPQAPQNKQIFNNFDWVAYKFQEAYLRGYIDEDIVECEVPRAGQVVTTIAGQNVLLFHGDGIRSTMAGVPWGGVMRRTNELKKEFIDNGVMLHGFALGHFHQACAVANIWMNGSVKGPDEYTRKQFGSGQRPTQLLLTFDADKERHTDVSYITP